MKYPKSKYRIFESKINNIIEKCKIYNIEKYEVDDDGLLSVYSNINMIGLKLNKLPLNFKEINGYFDISCSMVKSLKGSPKTVYGDYVFIETHIKNLKYCPKEVYGNFLGSENKYLTSFIEFPIYIKKDVYFDYCNLNNLYGIIDYVCGDLCVDYNKSLKSLKYGPKRVDGLYFCSFCSLTSLYGSSKYVGQHFDCSNNKLTSLKYSPRYIGGDFIFGNNNIMSFDYYPKFVGGNIDCNNTPLYNIWKLFGAEKYIEYFNQLKIIKDGAVNIKKLNLFLKSIGKEPVENVDGYINI